MGDRTKIQLICNQFFAWGEYGGYGAFTRKLGGELVKSGLEVECIVQKISPEQKPVGQIEVIDGVSVLTVPHGKIAKFRSGLYKTDADIIHSQSERLDTWLSFRANKEAKKVITFQDPWTPEDYKYNAPYLLHESLVKRLWSSYVELLYRNAVKKTDVTLTQAKFKNPAIQKMYKVTPRWFSNMVDVPGWDLVKSETPIVVFSNRLDPIKRPEIFCNLAAEFPDVEFYCLGKTNFGFDQTPWKNVKNLHFTGFISQEEKFKLLEKACVSVNTSVYECLPVAFLEACAYKCAILSHVNPDNFASEFGWWTPLDGYRNFPFKMENVVYNFSLGLSRLLENDTWKIAGERGHQFIKKYCNTPVVIDNHIKMYKELVEK